MDQVRIGEGEYIVNQFKHRNTLLLELSASLEREDALKQQLAEARSERGHAYQLATELEQQRDEWKAEAIYLRGLSAETVAGQELAIVKQQRDELLAAAENLVRVKGRHHTEQAYKQLKAAVAKVSK